MTQQETIEDIIKDRPRFMAIFTKGLTDWKDMSPNDPDYELYLVAQALLRIFITCDNLLTESEIKVLTPLLKA